MNLGLAIKRTRRELEVSQEMLSEKTGLSQTSISQIENGIKQPSKKSIEKISRALKVPEDALYLLGIEGDDIRATRKKLFEELHRRIEALAIELITGGKHKAK